MSSWTRWVVVPYAEFTTLHRPETYHPAFGCVPIWTNAQPLISSPVPLMAIREEYKNGSQEVLKKIDWLQANGWDQVWRARGDGDCFYRCESLCTGTGRRRGETSKG